MRWFGLLIATALLSAEAPPPAQYIHFILGSGRHDAYPHSHEAPDPGAVWRLTLIKVADRTIADLDLEDYH